MSKALLQGLTVVVKDLAWQDRDHLGFSSQYPNHIMVKEDPDSTDLSQLLDKWTAMGPSGEGEGDKVPGGQQSLLNKGERKEP